MRALAVAVVAIVAFAGQTPPESAGTAEARAAYDAGIAALRTGDRDAAVTLFRKAIDADPRFAAAHEQFISSQGGPGPRLETLYTSWAEAHPDNPVYEWALATLAPRDWTAAETHLRRAIAIAPSFARAYHDLALVDELRGDNRARLEHLKKASDLDPSNAAWVFSFASAMKAVDSAESVRLLQQVADRFPGTDSGAQGLYWAAHETAGVPAKLAIYERLRTQFPPEKYSWSESGMLDFFDVLVGIDPARAGALAADMEARIPAPSEKKAWRDQADYAAALTASAELRAGGHGRAAVHRLDGLKTPRASMDQAPLPIARALALEAAGDTAAAYASLVEPALKSPSDTLIGELTRLGAALNRTPAAVHADLRARRDADARPAPPFTLPPLAGGASVSLADFKGRVLLINFWYPSCGPCRGEMPLLQGVLDKYKDRRFAILAVNVLPEEKDLALSYLTRNRFAFQALDATSEWAAATYGIAGVPASVLIDADGRVVARPGLVTNARTQRALELQIESLLR